MIKKLMLDSGATIRLAPFKDACKSFRKLEIIGTAHQRSEAAVMIQQLQRGTSHLEIRNENDHYNII